MVVITGFDADGRQRLARTSVLCAVALEPIKANGETVNCLIHFRAGYIEC